MKQSGIIYHSKKLFWQKRLGAILLLLALVGLGLFFSPLLTPYLVKEEKTGFQPMIDQKIEKAIAQEQEEPMPQPIPEVQIRNFLLTIEKIGLKNALVIPNVDVNHSKEYKEALSQGLVHAQGTGFPDQGKLVYIFGHSTNYPWFVEQINALFYQIDKVEMGDKIKIEYNGQHYLYYVYDKQIVPPHEVHVVEEKLNEDILVLQSCYPPGTTWQRLLLFARPSKLGALIY